MRFRVLGPLEVDGDQGTVSLGGQKQRTVLALLLLHPNASVPRERLFDGLWAEAPPPSAADSLDTYVYRLRKLLGHDRIERRNGGYTLRVEPGELDADDFQRSLASAGQAAEAGDRAAAVDALTAALGLWRGRAWGDMLDLLPAKLEAQRLEDQRLSAVESRIELQLELGHGPELVGELEQLLSDQPLRERLVRATMLALYRAGRQTNALEVFQAARSRLVEELGLEPGPELHNLQRQILEHDPTLGAQRLRPSLSRSRRPRQLAVAAVVALAALVALVFVLSAGAAARRPRIAPGSSGVVAVDVASGRVTGVTPLGTPGSVADGGGRLWVASPGAQQVSVIDPGSGSGAIVEHIAVSGSPGSVAGGGGAIWIASSVGSTVTRIDPPTESVTQRISLPGANLDGITFGAGRVWALDSVEHRLFEIDPVAGVVERTLGLDLQPSAVAVGDAAIWIAGYGNATIEKLAPKSGRVIARVRVGHGPAALAFGAGSLWVANSLDSTVSRIDPSTLAVTATIPVGSGPTALAYAGGIVWVANQYSATVSRIDPRRNRVVGSVAVGGDPTSLTVSGGRVWVGVAAGSGSHRGGTLVILTPGLLFSSNPTALVSVDPAFYNVANNPQFTGLAYDSLVNFEQTPGADGLRLVPDLAVSIPPPSDGGRTFAFRIRPGIRYSDGQPVLAEDFRRAFERLFLVSSPGESLFEDIVGAGACIRQPRTCNLSQGIVTNNTTGAVTFHLTTPDPDFLLQLTEFAFAAPIPPGTPDHETGQHTVPGTGPYEIASVSDTEVRFVRNPFFREWSHAAQPEGDPDSIVWRSVSTAQAAVTAIEGGRADWLFGQIPAAQANQLELQDPAQLHSNPQFDVNFVPLNTRLAPFNNLKVRQALNYAINRATIVRLNGGSSFATPTCQLIAPGLTGYRRYCPYTMDPGTDGAWSAPDVKRARQLVAQSGTRGERIDVWGSPDNGFVPSTVPEYLAGVLRALGYRVNLHLVPTASLTEAMYKSFQLSADGSWVAAYPYPSSYVPSFVSCGGGNSNGYYCNRSLDREMQHAELLELGNPSKASTLWASIDRQLTNDAVWVPTVTQRDIEITSRRLRNYQYNPVWGFLADQAWLR